MHHVHVFALVAIAVLVAALCRRRGWPAPLVIVAVGLIASFVPGVPRFEIDATVILEFVLPPLLYSAALSSSYRDFRSSWNAITRLGVGLVLVTALAVALVAKAVHPSLSFAAALVLGAVVAPPDAVAAAAVGRRLGLPRRVMTLLSGESLINDATSLTLFKVALAGAATGTWLLGDGLGTFAMAVGSGVAVGAGIGWLVHAIRMRLDDPVVASAIGLLTPFAAYWGAEALLGSGVLAVVAAGLYLGHTAPRAGYATRLYEEPIWSTVDLVLEAFTFALVGVQLPWVVRDVVASDQGLRPAVVLSAAVLATAVLVRPAYVFATARFDNVRLRGSHRPVQDALAARESAVVSWAGMRGVVTLAAAAAIPATAGGAPFPERASLQLAACTVALGTLLLQGLTLPAVIGRLGVGSAAQAEAAEDATQEAQARLAMADAVQQMLERERTTWRAELGAQQADEAIDRLTRLTRERAAAAAVVIDPDNAEDLLDDGLTAWAPEHQRRADLAARTARVRRAVIGAQRAALVRRRDAGQIDEAVLRRMLHELDLEDESLSASWITRAGS
ncbi:cation:proton antiporter [Cellulomonas soli]